jgi:predicted small metal-binding protein
MPSFRCADVGMKCGFEVKNATTREEAMQIAAVHAKATHGMATIPPDVAAKVSAAIH